MFLIHFLKNLRVRAPKPCPVLSPGFIYAIGPSQHMLRCGTDCNCQPCQNVFLSVTKHLNGLWFQRENCSGVDLFWDGTYFPFSSVDLFSPVQTGACICCSGCWRKYNAWPLTVEYYYGNRKTIDPWGGECGLEAPQHYLRADTETVCIWVCLYIYLCVGVSLYVCAKCSDECVRHSAVCVCVVCECVLGVVLCVLIWKTSRHRIEWSQERVKRGILTRTKAPLWEHITGRNQA